MFNSIYSDELAQYYELRSLSLKDSPLKHTLCYLKRFDDFLCTNVDARGQLTETLMEKWVGTLNGKSRSIAAEITAVRKFLRYLAVSSGETVFIPMEPKVRDDYVPYLFSDDELDMIFHSADNLVLHDKRWDQLLAIESPVIFRLLYSCGLRIGETVRLKTSDVDLDNGILRMINTKGDKHRLVPVADGMKDILQRYSMAMGLVGKDDAWFFPSSVRDSHISEQSVKQIFERILSDNDIHLENRKKRERGPCLHCFRHVFAFKSFAKAEREGRHVNDAIPYLSIYLGHENLNETSKYLKFSSEMFPEALEAFGAYMVDIIPEVDYEM